jgi:hypothetical protein
MARVCVWIVIVSRNYRAWYVEILNDRQDIAEQVWQKSSNIFTSFALKVRRQKKRQQFLCLQAMQRLRSESRISSE